MLFVALMGTACNPLPPQDEARYQAAIDYIDSQSDPYAVSHLSDTTCTAVPESVEAPDTLRYAISEIRSPAWLEDRDMMRYGRARVRSCRDRGEPLVDASGETPLFSDAFELGGGGSPVLPVWTAARVAAWNARFASSPAERDSANRLLVLGLLIEDTLLAVALAQPINSHFEDYHFLFVFDGLEIGFVSASASQH